MSTTPTTPPPCDLTDDARARLAAYDARRAAHNERQRLDRLAAGRPPRSESFARTKPWEAAGMSQHKWRQKRHEEKIARTGETGPFKLGRPRKERASESPAAQS